MEVNAVGHRCEYLFYFKPYRGALSSVVNAWRYLSCWRRFKKTTAIFSDRNNKPDVLLAYILLRTACIAWWESKRHHIHYFISEQWSGFATGKADSKPWIWKRTCRYMMKNATGISAVSDFLKAKMEHFSGRNDIKVLHNVIEDVPCDTADHTVEPMVLLMVADMVDRIKNISGVLNVFPGIVRDYPHVELHLIGDGPDKAELLSMAKNTGLLGNKIFFEGRKNNQEVYTWLQRCSFLVMNSRHETFSLICAEALSCGRPVVATACGGPQEFITSDCGLLIPPDDDSALDHALRLMIQNHRDYDGQKLRQYASHKFGIQSLGGEFFRWLGNGSQPGKAL
jgi:glycosyltransferase involved in cell wall biosynthesis